MLLSTLPQIEEAFTYEADEDEDQAAESIIRQAYDSLYEFGDLPADHHRLYQELIDSIASQFEESYASAGDLEDALDDLENESGTDGDLIDLLRQALDQAF